jgi:hypothetical protein
MQSKELIG